MNDDLLGMDSADDGGGGGDDWLTTYADAITLLLAFFVMILGTATLDKAKYEEMRRSVQGAINHEAIAPQKTEEAPVAPEVVLSDTVKAMIVDRGIASHVEVSVANDVLNIEFSALGMFSPGRAELREDRAFFENLRDVAFAIRDFQAESDNSAAGKSVYIDIEGHSDNQPLRGSPRFRSNWELSGARAASIVRHLLMSKIVPPGQIRAISLADTHPKVPYDVSDAVSLEAVRAQNRRVVMKVRWLSNDEAANR